LRPDSVGLVYLVCTSTDMGNGILRPDQVKSEQRR
jgi:hypothetical protein